MLQPPGDLATLGAPQRLRPATVALTGFLILCDWIGSNENDFPATPAEPPGHYLNLSRQRAQAAIAQAGLVTSRPAPTYTTFSSLFPTILEPRPLQCAIDAVPADALKSPLLAVIEAPTGEGKTEAALALAQRIAAHSTSDELFFALPTMATSNQMYGRVTTFYHELYGAAVQLTHSQAVVQKEELRRAALTGSSDAATEPQADSALAAIEWFAGPKKAMLAPFGVGTVDQVELAGLNVRHYVLRLFALAGKVVIIDEVHAYDAYMSTILQHTLAWLASLGTSVLLLSATLPAARHRELAASYLRGLERQHPAPKMPGSLPYPAISLYRAGETEPYRATPGVFRKKQQFTLHLFPAREAEHDARHLLDLVREGGAVARIVNRVDDAQATYQALKALLPASHNVEVVLLHGRLPLKQRVKREEQINVLVGKESTRTPDQPLIIIGTQVLEQSLDYDVDVMVSDAAPIDLLLQRAGRLHRHKRARPPRHAQPALEMMLPLDAKGLPVWKQWEVIYAPYVLWRTWEVLRNKASNNACDIVLPDDYRSLIEAVYAETPSLPTGTPYASAVAAAWNKLHQAQRDEEAQARQQLIPGADAAYDEAITHDAGFSFVEDENGALAGWQIAKTRLGDRITVVPLYRHSDNRLTLDAGGTDELSRDVPPHTPEELKAVLMCAISISYHDIIQALRAETQREHRWPWPQREVPQLLRSLVPLILDSTTATAVFDKRTVRLDPDLGLVIEKR